MTPIKTASTAVAATLMTFSAHAHSLEEAHDHIDFWVGFAHPWLGSDHLLAMFGVGLWGALSARKASAHLAWGPVGFVTMLLLGALLGTQGWQPQVTEALIAASLLAVGAGVVSRWQASTGVVLGLVGGFALFHGVAHGAELGANPAALAGMAVATLCLHAAGMGMGLALRMASPWVSRAVGLAVGVWGLVLLAA